MRKFQISSLVEEMYTERIKKKKKKPEAVSQNYWRKQRSGKNEEEPFYTN